MKKLKKRQTAAVLITGLVLSTSASGDQHQASLQSADEHYSEACRLALEGSHTPALDRLQSAFESGYPTPMDVVSDSCFAGLIADSILRPNLRDLLGHHARQSATTMVQLGEPGERIVLRGRIELNRSGGPLVGAKVHLVHAATNGKYFEEKSLFNPRLFAYLVTDEDGWFQVTTIRPGAYAGDDGVMETPHFHITASFPGCYTLNGEILLSEEMPSSYHPQWASGKMTANLNGELDGMKVYTVTVILDETPVESGRLEVEPHDPEPSER